MKSETLEKTSSDWITQVFDDITCMLLAPILNNEAHFSSGVNIRSAGLSAGYSILQVNNTFITIEFRSKFGESVDKDQATDNQK